MTNQVAAAVSYIVYMGMSVWGATAIRIGMNYAELLPDGAPSSLYLNQYGHYFAASTTPPLEVALLLMS